MEIHRQLRGIASDRVVGLGPKKILSVPDAIGMALEDWWRDHTQGVQQDLLSDAVASPRRAARERHHRDAGTTAVDRDQWLRQAPTAGHRRRGCPTATPTRPSRSSARVPTAAHSWSSPKDA